MLFLLLRIAFVVNLCLLLGALLGILVYVVLNWAFDKLVRTVFGLQQLNSMDKNLYYDQVTNRCNIFGCVIFTKTTPEAIREIMGKRYAGQYTRMRSRVVKKFDNYYFKEITGDEL